MFNAIYKFVAILSLFLGWLFIAPASALACGTIKYDKENLFITKVTVVGPRGALFYDALVDTGASNTVVPRTIIDGIGYRHSESAEFQTAGGVTSFEGAVVESLSFLDMTYKRAKVFVEKKDRRFKLTISSKGIIQEDRENEGIIGMDILSKLQFSYQNNNLTICGREE
jgi:predicted aspartyl protease